jgi:glycosyltransferase 2 family protein
MRHTESKPDVPRVARARPTAYREGVLSLVFRVGLAAAAMAALVLSGAISSDGLEAAREGPDLVLAAFLALLTTVPLSGVRWWLLMRGLGSRRSCGWAIGTTFIGALTSTFLPGSHGGDLVRVGLASREERLGLSRAAVSVLVDRLAGLVALIAVCLFLLPALPGSSQRQLMLIAGGLLLAGAVSLGLALVLAAPLVALLARLPGRLGTTLAATARDVLSALGAYLPQPQLLIAAVAISAVQYVLVLAAILALGHAMQFHALSAAGYAVAGGWSMLANALPLTPGGIGVGEAAFAQAARLLEETPSGDAYATVFLAQRVLSALVGALGVIPLLLMRADLRGSVALARQEAARGT